MLIRLKFFESNLSRLIRYSIWFLIISSILLAILIFNSKADYQQKLIVKIIYIHLPISVLATSICGVIGLLSLINLIYKNCFIYIYSVSLVRLNLIYASLSIFSGMMWAKPIWGVYWLWDARLTSMLILLLFCISQNLLISSTKNILLVKDQFMILSILSAINVPIVKLSVYLWSSIHQTSSLFKSSGPSMTKEMLTIIGISFLLLIYYSWLISVIQFMVFYKKLKILNRKNFN